jgi:hypothetical protein
MLGITLVNLRVTCNHNLFVKMYFLIRLSLMWFLYFRGFCTTCSFWRSVIRAATTTHSWFLFPCPQYIPYTSLGENWLLKIQKQTSMDNDRSTNRNMWPKRWIITKHTFYMKCFIQNFNITDKIILMHLIHSKLIFPTQIAFRAGDKLYIHQTVIYIRQW